MYGFSGQNTNIWLEYFKDHPKHKVTFITPRLLKQTLKPAENISIISLGDGKYSSRILASMYYRYMRMITRIKISARNYDLFILHGLYNWRDSIIFFGSVNARKKIVLLWNDTNHVRILQNIKSNTAREMLTVLEKADNIYPTWDVTRKSFLQSFPHLSQKTKTRPWGVRKDLFVEPSTDISKINRELMATLSRGKVFMFWPRSIHKNIRHDILLQSIKLVSEEISLVSFLAMGRMQSTLWSRKIIKQLHSLENSTEVFAEYSKHLPLEDIIPLYNRADLMVNLADTDQLSSCILEAFLSRTRIVLSNIPAYQELLLLGFHVTLTENTPESVASAIKKVVSSLGTEESEELIENNRMLVLNKYNVDNNITKIIDV